MALIFLVGARGCGKSTVGKMLAKRLNWPFADLDELFCQEAGQSIADFVRLHGWEKFRQMESDILRKTSLRLQGQNAVISTGGGVVLAPANRQCMCESGAVVWLAAPAGCLRDRLAAKPQTGQRPPLSAMGLLEEIEQVLRERTPLYEQCCHCEVDGSQSPASICDSILAQLPVAKAH